LDTDTYDDEAKKKIKDLRQTIRKSNHRGFIIKQDPGEPPFRPAWDIVTVDLANSDPQLQQGRYIVMKWPPKEENATKQIRRSCRYVPDIIHPRTKRRLHLKPEKALKAIKRAPIGYEWTQCNLDLQKHGLVVPLDLEKQHQISQKIWNAFTREAKAQDVDTHPLNAVVPLD
jgi:hypothetical protein